MKSKFLLPKLLLVCFIINACFYGFTYSRETKACFNNSCFSLEVAEDEETRFQGLMFREDLADDEGMLFLFKTESRYGFWMKNTSIPLDIIWVNSQNNIVHIEEEIRPCQDNNCPVFYSQENALYVLELKAGTVKKSGIKVGNKVSLDEE